MPVTLRSLHVSLLHATAAEAPASALLSHSCTPHACAVPQQAAAGPGGRQHAARVSSGARLHERVSAPAGRAPGDGAPLLYDRPRRRATSEPAPFEAGMSDPASCAPLLSALAVCNLWRVPVAHVDTQDR